MEIKMDTLVEEVPEINRALLWLILEFLRDNDKEGLDQRKLYVYPEDLANLPLLPKGKLVQITFNLVSRAKIENRPE